MPEIQTVHVDSSSGSNEEGSFLTGKKLMLVWLKKYPVSLTKEDIKTQVLDVVKEAKQIVDLIGADVIVSVGRGIGKDIKKGIELAGELADAFGGGVVGGSRVTIDSGWLSADHQVGQTGKTVHPKVYVALGISGAIQHKSRNAGFRAYYSS